MYSRRRTSHQCFSGRSVFLSSFSFSVFQLFLLADFSPFVSSSWYCRDATCAAPLSEGIVGYNYRPPTEDAALNGYLSVSAGQEVKVFKVTQQPDILEIEVDGKRGFVPRTAIDVTKFFVEHDQYVIVEDGRAPFDYDPHIPDVVAVKPAEAGKEHVDGQEVPETVSMSNSSIELNFLETNDADVDPGMEFSTVSEEDFNIFDKNSSAKEDSVQDPQTEIFNSSIETSSTTIVGSTFTNVNAIDAERETFPSLSQSESANSVEATGIIAASVMDKEEPEIIKADLSRDAVKMPTVEELAARLAKHDNSVDTKPNLRESSLVQNMLTTPTIAEPPAVTTFPIVENSTALESLSSKLNSPDIITPTASVRLADEPVLVKEESPEIKHPEPKVTFQAGDPFASLNQYYPKNEQPIVLTTALPHRHHHHHSHGDHGHSHGHDHHGSHSHHNHDHDHGHDHDHSHDHHHDHVHPESTTQQSERATEIQAVSNHVKPAALATPEFIPPEDATVAPVNYEQLVQDRLDGNTVPGLLSDSLKKDPHDGFPTPPPGINPATATQAPIIPGSLQQNALPSSEMNVVVASNPRYQNQDKGLPFYHEQDQELPKVSRLDHFPASDHNHDHDHHHHEHANHDEVHHEHVQLPEVPQTGACSVKTGDLSDDVPCDEIVPEYFEDLSKPRVDSQSAEGPGWQKKLLDYFHIGAVEFAYGWNLIVREFERVSADLRLVGMIILSLSTLTFMAAAASDRRIRRALENGFEEYDYKKESELVNLREQNKNLLKQIESLSKANPSQIAPPPPVVVSPMLEMPRPCTECESLRQSLNMIKGTIPDERVLQDLQKKNDEVRKEFSIVVKDRDELRHQLETLQHRFAELEKKKQVTPPAASSTNAEMSRELDSLQQQLSQVNQDNQRLHKQLSQFNESSSRCLILQTERDEAHSNIKFLKQLLSEKEEDIRKVRTTEASGTANIHREMQERTEELRSARRQLRTLQEEMESLKRDREAQVQIRCQTFRNAADKAQRDSLLARHEALTVRQQLEELCRKYGEQIPVMINGAATPPGLMPAPPLLFSGVGYPPGPPPATFEAFRQQVLAQGGHKSGSASPLSPLSDKEQRKDKRNGSKRADVHRNGNDGGMFDDSDDDRRKKDRSHR